MNGPKGLDDLFLAGGRPRIRRVSFLPTGLGARQRPHAIAGSGPVTNGGTLQAARESTARAIRDFVRNRRRNKGKALLVRSAAGSGKSTSLGQALAEFPGNARVVVGTIRLAAELAAAHGYQPISGRNPRNCSRYEIVRVLGERGHPVEELACGTPAEPRCLFRNKCDYYTQFEAPGTWVAASEQLYNPNFLRGGDLIVLDDADLARAMIATYFVPGTTLDASIEQLRGTHREPVRSLLVVLHHAVLDAPAKALIGPAAWDHLALTARRQGLDIVSLIEGLPKGGTLPEPATNTDGFISTATVEAVPPASIQRVIVALKEELFAFLAGEDFNSRLRLGSLGVEVRILREHARRHLSPPFVVDMAMLVLDATPLAALVDRLCSEHERLADIEAAIALSASVTVVQYAARTNGHTSMANETNAESVLAEILAEREEHPVERPEHEAVIGYKGQRERLVSAGFPESQVLSYGSVRGSNALVDVRRLHVVGRPMPPGGDLVYIAQVIHYDEDPVSDELVLQEAPYGSQPYAIKVVDYADRRVSALLHASREDELVQVVHRARLLTLATQLRLKSEGERQEVRVVIHASQPVPGLRVDRLVLGEPAEDLNASRAREAEDRIRQAATDLRAGGQPITVRAVADAARADRRTAARVLGKLVDTLKEDSQQDRGLAAGDEGLGKVVDTLKELGAPAALSGDGLGTMVDTLKRDLLKGLRHVPQTDHPHPAHWEPCRGCCGRWMPPGQKCFDCAAAAVAAWKSNQKRRPTQAVSA